jgi:hypothetical protein
MEANCGVPAKKDPTLFCRLFGHDCVSGKEAMMRVKTRETRASVVAFASTNGPQDAAMVADDAGQHIVALVQRASDMAKTDCQRAMDLAHRVSSELRSAEERARALEEEASYFRDRAARAEEWLVRIERELQQTFFQNKS